MKGRLSPVILFSAFLAAALAGSGCPGNGLESIDFSAKCGVAGDQKGSFMAPVGEFPVAVSLDTTFTDEQRREITLAAGEWNAFARKLMGKDFFSLSVTAVPESDRTGNPRDCSQTQGSDTAFSIVREQSNEHWQALQFNSQIPAATLRCEGGGALSHQVVLINTAIADPQQLRSIAIHELGHALGLDHSCTDSSGHPDYRVCAGLTVTDPYRQAVMYPSLHRRASSLDLPEMKESLRTNDMERAKCLYAP